MKSAPARVTSAATPRAVAASVADRIWSLTEIAGLLD